MNRTRTMPTRRKRAMRWIAALLAVVLGNQLLGLYCVTPGQALDQTAARYGLAPMEVWTALDTSQAQDETLRRWVVTCNDDYLLLSTVHFTPWRGWSAASVTLLADGNRPVSVGKGAFLNGVEQGYETTYLFFGSVRDPEVTAVEAAVRHGSMTEDETGAHMVNFDWQRACVPADAFQTAGSRRVFLAVLDPVYDPGGSTYPETRVSVFRGDGSREELEEIEGGLDRR